MNNYIIAASILDADNARLGEEVQSVISGGADWIHIDIFDNHYVSNLAFGPRICADLRKFGVKVPMEIHLAAKPINNLISMFADAGANMITFHPEAVNDINDAVNLISSRGLRVGLAFSANISLAILNHLRHPIDLISILGVKPGFGGQVFNSNVYLKIREARTWIDQHNISIRLGVDGGINLNNIKNILDAGADAFMIGTSIFNTSNYHSTIEAFRRKINNLCCI